MRLKEAIKRADELRPNTVSEEQKAAWVYELEGKLAEIMEREAQENPWPEDAALSMPSPCDNVYELYLCAMIDWAVEDTDLYGNDMTMFINALGEAKAWWRRSNRPRSSGSWKVM